MGIYERIFKKFSGIFWTYYRKHVVKFELFEISIWIHVCFLCLFCVCVCVCVCVCEVCRLETLGKVKYERILEKLLEQIEQGLPEVKYFPFSIDRGKTVSRSLQ